MRVTIDGVIFQLQAGKPLGISRIWKEILPRLIKSSPEMQFTLLQRGDFAFPFECPVNAHIETMPLYDWSNGTVYPLADLFMSTYYTYAPGTKTLLYIYDMIPELLHWNGIEWSEKTRAIRLANKIVCMSQNTANDLRNSFHAAAHRIEGIVYGGVSDDFYPATQQEVDAFRSASGLTGPFIMLSGNRNLYKNGNTIFTALPYLDPAPSILLAGGEDTIPSSIGSVLDDYTVVHSPHMDSDELRAAYSCAELLYYPSQYEGFGLPILEAMACGCPVVVGPALASREFSAGVAAFLDDPYNPGEIVSAIDQVNRHRESMVVAGIKRAANFTWDASVRELRKAMLS